MLFRRSPQHAAARPPTADVLLASMAGGTIDLALAAALPTAATREHVALVERLLDRDTVAARLALVKCFHRLEPRAAALVRGAADRGLDAAVRRAFGSGSDATRNALRLIGERHLCHLAYLVVDATAMPRRDLAGEASLVLARLAAEAIPGSPQAASLAAAVDPAIAAWGRRTGDGRGHEGLLTAFLLLSLEGFPAATRALEDEEHPAIAPLARRLAKADDAAERGALLPLLALGSLREAALQGLSVAARERPFRGVFPDPTVLHDPAIRGALAEVKRPDRLCPAAWPADASTAEKRGWIELMCLLPLADEPRGRWLAMALEDPEPRVRGLALTMAARPRGGRLACRTLSAAAARLARSDEPFEARFAARIALATAGSQLKATLQNLAASPRPQARAVAQRAATARAAEALLALWEHSTDAERTLATRACLELPGGEAALRARLCPQERSDAGTRRRLQSIRATLGGLRRETPATAVADPMPAKAALPATADGESVPPPESPPPSTASAKAEAALQGLDRRLRKTERRGRIALPPRPSRPGRGLSP